MHYMLNKIMFGMTESDIFILGKRNNNPKRNFLFISKLLGKHLAVNPETVRLSGYMLSSIKYGKDGKVFSESIKRSSIPINIYEPIAEDPDMLVIGFCETATALGMSVASSIRGCTYQTTTREKICGMEKLLSFEEEHSHATTHCIFSKDHRNFDRFRKITLVDDEITTGKSLLNLMNKIEENFHMEEYNIMTFLDWRNDEQKAAFNTFADIHDTVVNIYSLASGSIVNDENDATYNNGGIPFLETSDCSVTPLNIFKRIPVMYNDGQVYDCIAESGRFGISWDKFAKIESDAANAACGIADILNLNSSDTVMVIGRGEDIYIPSRVAAHLHSIVGCLTRFKTTTRSPIFCDGQIIQDVVTFDDRGSNYYFYNTGQLKGYSHVIILNDFGTIPLLSYNCTEFSL